MAYIEAEFCPRDEYTDHRETRVKDFNEELYTVMFAVKFRQRHLWVPGPAEKQGAKLPGEIKDLRRIEAGVCQARLILMDADLRTLHEMPEVTIREGLLEEAPGFYIPTTQGVADVEEAYFREYSTETDDAIAAILAGTANPGRQLVPA